MIVEYELLKILKMNFLKSLQKNDGGLAILKMSRGSVGSKTGGHGSWRRKTKKVSKNNNQEGQKVWLQAQRLGCRDLGEIDNASIMLTGEEEALSFSKPQLSFNMHANTYCLMGTPEKKKMADVITDFISSIDFSKFAKDKKEEGKENDLGDVPENVDFSKPEGEENKTENNTEEKPADSAPSTQEA